MTAEVFVIDVAATAVMLSATNVVKVKFDEVACTPVELPDSAAKL